MKKVLTCLMLLSFNLFAKVDLSGSGRVRYVEKNNKDFSTSSLDKKSATGMRFRLNVNATSGKKWNVFVQPQFTKVMGSKVQRAATSSDMGASGSLEDTMVNAHQMYLNYKSNDYFSLQAGRMEINLGDQLLIGSVGYDDVGRSFDGFSYLGKCLISGTNQVFALKAAESSTSLDYDIYGLYHSQSLAFIKNFDLYWIRADNRTISNSTTQFDTLGLRLKSKNGNVDYRVEADSQNGDDKNISLSDQQYDLELGYTFTFKNTRLAFEYFNASQNYNQLAPTGHKWLGHADMFSRKNIKGFVIHQSSQLSEKTQFFTDVHFFSRKESTVDAYKFNGTVYTGTSNIKLAIANEVDFYLKHQLDQGLAMKIGYSLVIPGEYLKALSPTFKDNMTYLYAEMSAKF